MKTGILIGYYVNEQDACNALRKLRRQGYRCAASVSKRTEGGIHIVDPFGHRRILGAVAAFILLGSIAAVIALMVPWQISPFGQTLSVLIPAAACGVFGGPAECNLGATVEVWHRARAADRSCASSHRRGDRPDCSVAD